MINHNVFKILLTWYPPYLGSGIYVRHISEDFRHIQVEMKMRFYNRNYMGTHFGGSLYAMTDPFYALMIIQILGHDYVVWDKAATIEFVSPGKGKVIADFRVTDEMTADIQAHTGNGEKYLPKMTVDVRDQTDRLVARIHKTLYIRKKADTGKISGKAYTPPLMIRIAEGISSVVKRF